LIRPFLKREAVLSSRIEGTVTRLDELLRFEAQAESNTEIDSDINEVLNYVTALDYGLLRLAEEMPLRLRLLQEIHEKLMWNVRGSDRRPGEFRKSNVLIARPGQSPDEARFVPPLHTELLPLLTDFEKFLNEPGDMPLVVQLASAHYQFEAIHPFTDGNGRIGRLLITLMLCERKCLPQPMLYLSAYFERHDAEYRDHLLSVSQRASWEDWIAFFRRRHYRTGARFCAASCSTLGFAKGIPPQDPGRFSVDGRFAPCRPTLCRPVHHHCRCRNVPRRHA